MGDGGSAVYLSSESNVASSASAKFPLKAFYFSLVKKLDGVAGDCYHMMNCSEFTELEDGDIWVPWSL